MIDVEIIEKIETDPMESETTVEVIRERLREDVFAERKHHREVVLNKNRVALGEAVENSSFTPDFVREKAKTLKNKHLSVEEYRELQNALIQREENVNSFLKVDHILFAIVRDLSGNDQTIQLYAANCCCNLALGNAKACTALAKNLAPYLVTILETLNRPLLEVCAWTIGNLASGSDKAFEILQAQNCLKFIITLITESDSAILPSITYAAAHYLKAGFHLISENEMIELASAITERKFTCKDPYFLWLLALLSSKKACSIYVCKMVPPVIEYLYQDHVNDFPAVTEVTACVRIMANTVCEVSGQVALMFLQHSNTTQTDLINVLNKLLSHQYVHVRKETIWLIGNLHNHICLTIQDIIRSIIPELSNLKQAVASLSQQFV